MLLRLGPEKHFVYVTGTVVCLVGKFGTVFRLNLSLLTIGIATEAYTITSSQSCRRMICFVFYLPCVLFVIILIVLFAIFMI